MLLFLGAVAALLLSGAALAQPADCVAPSLGEPVGQRLVTGEGAARVQWVAAGERVLAADCGGRVLGEVAVGAVRNLTAGAVLEGVGASVLARATVAAALEQPQEWLRLLGLVDGVPTLLWQHAGRRQHALGSDYWHAMFRADGRLDVSGTFQRTGAKGLLALPGAKFCWQPGALQFAAC